MKTIVNNRGLSLINVLIALGLLSIFTVGVMKVQSVVYSKSIQLKQANNFHVYALNLKKRIKKSEGCTQAFAFNKQNDLTQKYINAKLVNPYDSANNLHVEFTNRIELQAPSATSDGFYYSDSFLVGSKKQIYLGPVYMKVNQSGEVKDCYSKISPKDRCERNDGVYLANTKQCKLATTMCSSGYYVKSGTDKYSWSCDTGTPQ